MIEVTTNKRSQQVLLEIPKQARQIPEKIEQALKEIGSEVVRENRQLIKSGNKTGRIYQTSGKTHQASSPGEAPANLTGRLARSANYNVRNAQQMSVGQSEFYAVFLENGTTKMEPRPNLIAAINNKAGDTYTTLEDAIKDL